MQCSTCGGKIRSQTAAAWCYGRLSLRRSDRCALLGGARRRGGVSHGRDAASQQCRVASRRTSANDCSPVPWERGGGNARQNDTLGRLRLLILLFVPLFIVHLTVLPMPPLDATWGVWARSASPAGRHSSRVYVALRSNPAAGCARGGFRRLPHGRRRRQRNCYPGSQRCAPTGPHSVFGLSRR